MNNEQRRIQYQPKTLSLNTDKDLVKIREYGRSLAASMGFSENNQTAVSTALSEICRNVLEYADSGEVTIEPGESERRCILITVKDEGPGIEDVNRALQEGYSSGMGLGIGLPGAKRIMDRFEIKTSAGEGTTIRMCKWLNNHKDVLE